MGNASSQQRPRRRNQERQHREQDAGTTGFTAEPAARVVVDDDEERSAGVGSDASPVNNQGGGRGEDIGGADLAEVDDEAPTTVPSNISNVPSDTFHPRGVPRAVSPEPPPAPLLGNSGESPDDHQDEGAEDHGKTASVEPEEEGGAFPASAEQGGSGDHPPPPSEDRSPPTAGTSNNDNNYIPDPPQQTNTEEWRSNPDTYPYAEGEPVRIIGGKNKDKSGSVDRRTRCFVFVRLNDNSDNVVRGAPKNVKPCRRRGGGRHYHSHGNASSSSNSNNTNTPPMSSPEDTHEGDACSTAMDDMDDTSSTGASSVSLEESHEKEHWKIPGGEDPLLHSCLGLPEDYRRLTKLGHKTKRHSTFAFHLFQNRIVMLKVDVKKGINDLPRRYTESDGRIYELLATKMNRKSERFPRMELTLAYVLVGGPGVRHPIHLQEELDKIAAFGRLRPEKVVARLSLFQSTAQKSNRTGREYLIFDDLSSVDFQLIPEAANEGCGFIPREFILRFLGNHARGKRTFALQVRVFAPKLGIFKGMLVEKPGISKIQLPESMLKVGPSETCGDGDDNACILVTSNGVFPSSNHLQVAKLVNGEDAAKSFFPRKLNSMILTLLETLGVPRSVLDEYQEESHGNQGRGLKHASSVGLADPTNYLPDGHVFITGIKDSAEIRDQIFVSRYPCTEHSDGYLLPVVRSKPAAMPDSMWSWLCDLHFGGIIFANPLPNSAPLPTLIANGDLDGDLYFICWNEDIITHISPVQPIACDLNEHEHSSDGDGDADRPWNENWFSDGQDLMRSVEAQLHHLKLISTLYKKMNDSGKEIGYEHPDTVALGRAYKEALDIPKHGGKVHLPEHLWRELPSHLHQYLSCVD